MSSPQSENGFDSMFTEPESFRPVVNESSSTIAYERHQLTAPDEGIPEIQVSLISGHPLWGHILYPAAICLGQFLELHPELVKGKNVLELGAGGGLPGLVASLEGAKNVVITDFPDASLVNNIQKNIKDNITNVSTVAKTTGMGFTWGTPIAPLLEPLPTGEKFDLILLSDLVFNHSQHSSLLTTCLQALSPTVPSTSPPSAPSQSPFPLPAIDFSTSSLSSPLVLCFFSHHRPTEELMAADLGLLSLARAEGWKVERVWKDREAGPAFPEDGGSICIRSTVHGWAFTRA